MKRLLSFFVFATFLSGCLVGLSVWHDSKNGNLQLSVHPSTLSKSSSSLGIPVAQGVSIDTKSLQALENVSKARVALSKAVVPSVVSISSIKKLTPQQRRMLQDPLFRYFYGDQGNSVGGDDDDGLSPNLPNNGIAQRALGSGVIVSKDGLIITNNHVVSGMDQIEVELYDHRRLKAEVVGSDAPSDLALLRIHADNIQALPFGDSDKVEVGESVLAIGNPYGLAETVTQGIISAKGRSGGADSVNEFFQIDAAINPGNSGGALIDVSGNLIGINAAIFSQSGGFQGVGFAIPSNTAKRVMDNFLKYGRVIRGYLGVDLRPISAEEAKRANLPNEQGALIAGVQPNSPAANAGLKPGDFIEKFNGKKVNDILELRRLVASVDVDQTVPLEVLRDGKEQSLNVKIGEQSRAALVTTQRNPMSRGGNSAQPAPQIGQGPLAGIVVQTLSSNVTHQLGLPPNINGVVVSSVAPNAPASAFLQQGDVIESINQQPATSVQQYNRVVESIDPTARVALSVIRNRTRSLLVIEP